ncbi:hypothetical protein BB737_05140 [Mycobacterium avium subsp. hominissuis]|nr:hypothetical protein BB737_05140 [Mycobacterium avium subsp. hominissuis]
MLLLPVYVAWMIGVEAFFDSSGLNTHADLPAWLLVAFTLTALAACVIVAWFITQKARGKISVTRERAYVGLLITVVVSGFIDDALKGLASLVFHAKSIWVLIPLYILSWVVLLAVGAVTMSRMAARSGDTPASKSERSDATTA